MTNPEARSHKKSSKPEPSIQTNEFNEIPPSYMTRVTWEKLKADLILEEQKAIEANLQKGEAAGQGSDWHDNPAYDQAILDAGVAESRVNTIRERLHNVVVIEPRTDTDVVGLGNIVVLRYPDEDEDEKFVILGPADSQVGADKDPQWISFETPIGKAIMGKKAGDKVPLSIPSGETVVTIKKILPGQF